MHAITIRHNFESGHRLPHLPGKCTSLHGHSFQCAVTIESASLDQGISVEYADAKKHLRRWVDDQWDHGLILGGADPLVPILQPHGKVYVLADNEWPTVETLCMVLGGVIEAWCYGQNRSPQRGDRPTIHVRRVEIQETGVNGAVWSPEPVL